MALGGAAHWGQPRGPVTTASRTGKPVPCEWGQEVVELELRNLKVEQLGRTAWKDGCVAAEPHPVR